MTPGSSAVFVWTLHQRCVCSAVCGRLFFFETGRDASFILLNFATGHLLLDRERCAYWHDRPSLTLSLVFFCGLGFPRCQFFILLFLKKKIFVYSFCLLLGILFGLGIVFNFLLSSAEDSSDAVSSKKKKKHVRHTSRFLSTLTKDTADTTITGRRKICGQTVTMTTDRQKRVSGSVSSVLLVPFGLFSTMVALSYLFCRACGARVFGVPACLGPCLLGCLGGFFGF